MLCLQTPAQEKDSGANGLQSVLPVYCLLSSRCICMCQSWKRLCVRLLLNPSVHHLTKQHEREAGGALTWGSHKSKSQSLILWVFFLNHKRWRVPLWAQDLTSKDFRDLWTWLLSRVPCCEVVKGKASSPLVNIFQRCNSIREMPSCQ